MKGSNGLPGFVERGGELVIRHPLMLEKALFRGFLLEGDRDKLQAMCDKIFNVPSQGALNYRPLSNTVLLSFTTVQRAYSTHPQDKHFGWVEEIDVAFWVPLLSQRRGKLHLSWYIPYIFVDNPFALATGREGYGFPKTMGRFTIADSPECPGSYSVETLAWDHYSPQTRAQPQQMIEVVPRQDLHASSRFESSLESVWQLLWRFTQGDSLGARLEIPRAEMDNFLHGGQAPIVFLRQLRDIRDPEHASYQEIVEAPARISKVHGGGLMPHPYEVRVAASASHPIAEELGLCTEGQVAKAAFWAHFDFLMESGERLWCAGGEDAHSAAGASQPAGIGYESPLAFATPILDALTAPFKVLKMLIPGGSHVFSAPANE